jgi:hypothetical protein
MISWMTMPDHLKSARALVKIPLQRIYTIWPLDGHIVEAD